MSSKQGPTLAENHAIALGTHLGPANEETDAQYAEAIVGAVSSGCEWIDTAPNYRRGRSERTIGAAIATLADQQTPTPAPSIVTKAGFLPADPKASTVKMVFDRLSECGETVAHNALDPEFLLSSLSWSRANLSPASSSFVLLHNPELHVQRLRDTFYDRVIECFSILEEECSAGRLKGYGFSSWEALRVPPDHPNYIDLYRLCQASVAHHRLTNFKLVQLPFNMAQTEAFTLKAHGKYQRRVTALELCSEFGLTVMASNPLHQGLLATLPPLVRATLPGYASDAARAIQFVRSTPGIAITIVGMKRLDHVRANCAIRDIPLLTRTQYTTFYE